MSFRSATRLASRLASASATRAPIAARRAASNSAKKPASDATWMMGSAVVFGGLSAYILLPSTSKPHDAHASHAAIGHDHKSGADKGEDEGPSGTHETESNLAKEEADDDSAGDKPVHATQGGRKSEDIPTKKVTDASSGTQEKWAKPAQTVADDKASSDAEEQQEDSGEGRKAEDIPSEEISDAIHRGEKTDVPKIAMDEEAKGHQTQAELDK
ncbi:hypothetical protein P7C73_g4325, partial [Tremellales sp. Uapishka_1]